VCPPPGLHYAFQRTGELFQCDPECPAEHPQFHHVNPALATFALADERLGLPNTFGHPAWVRPALLLVCLKTLRKVAYWAEWIDFSIACRAQWT
jgi:hypothetical protein